MTKKKSIIVLVGILIVISLVISIYMPNKLKLKESIEDDSKSYYLYKKDEKFGVIDGEGKIIIEAEYEKIEIPNIHRAVFVCTNEDNHKIINEKNEEIFKKYENVQAIKLGNVISESTYEKKVLSYEKDGKFGLIGIDGEVITQAKYEEISSIGYKQGEILVKEDEKYGIIDSTGKTMIKNLYDSIISDKYYNVKEGYSKSGYIVCRITNEGYRYGYYDYQGSQILETEYNNVIRLTQIENSDNIHLIASKNGQFGVFVNNNKIINTQYQSISYDNGIGMFIVERTNQYGAINDKGVEILKTEYSDIQINGIYMYTQKGEEKKVFNKEGNEVEVPIETIVEATTNPEYYIKCEQNEQENYSILNSNLEEITTQKYQYLEYAFNKYFIATNFDGKSGVIDYEGNIIINFEHDLIQSVKNKNIIQVIDFENSVTQIYNNELNKILEIKDIQVQTLEDYIKVYNEEEEYYLDNNGNKIEGEKMDEITKNNALLRIGNFKRVTYGLEQYYYIEAN